MSDFPGRRRLQTLLDGGVPDAPPHWELAFQIPQELLGLDPTPVKEAPYGSEQARREAQFAFHVEVHSRLIDECGWSAVPAAEAYNADSIAPTKRALGHAALVPGYEGGGVFWMPTGTEMMNFAVRLHENRDDILDEARRRCDAAKDQLRRMADAGADFFVLTYDFGFNDAPFVSPATFRWLVTPFLTEIVETAHALGKRAILHSDGCLTRILDQIHNTGVDGYQSVDPQGHMDIRAVRETYPDWLLMGNVPCNLMQDVDEVAIDAAVDYCMTYGGVGRRFIFSTSNCIFAGMPARSYRAMLDSYRRRIPA